MVGDPGQWNQHTEYLQYFLHLWVYSQELSWWRRGSSVWGWILQSPTFSIPFVSRYYSELTIAPVGYAFNIPQNSEHDFANKHYSLNLFGAGYLLQHTSNDCILFSGLKWCTRLSYMVIILFINPSLWCSWCGTNYWSISNTGTHLPAAHIYNYSLQSLTQNGCFVHYFLLGNTTLIFNKTLVCLISCSSWTSAMLLLIHVQGNPLELSTTNMCGPLLNSTHVSTFFYTKKLSFAGESRSETRQELIYFKMFQPHWHVTLRQVYKHYSELSSGGSLNFSHTV